MVNKLHIRYRLLKFFVGLFVIRRIKIKVMGRSNLLPDKAIITSNHIQVFDPPLIFFILKRHIHFFAGVWLYKIKVLKGSWRFVENYLVGSLLGLFLKVTQQIPVEKGNKRLNEKAFKKAKKYLQRGDYIGIFPFGGYDDIEKKPMIGAAKLSIDNDVPVIPIYLSYPCVRDPDSLKTAFKEVTVKIGKPIYSSSFKKGEKEKQYKNMANCIIKQIYELK